MKILLAAINAKYIHSNLAVYSLRAYANEFAKQIEIAEFSINQPKEEILEQIYKKRADILCFSCYIWNLELIEDIMYDFHQLCPQVPIWLGGPEVSYETEAFLQKHPEAAGVMVGEGEETFLMLCRYYQKRQSGFCQAEEELAQIDGIVFQRNGGGLLRTKPRLPMELSRIPFYCQQTEIFANRIIYYESSRGCPFSCSYCLSSVDRALRFREIGLVKKELSFFLEQKVRQVKFVDRTFNCSHSHAQEIWRFIRDHDNGITNFHFEISADLLTEEELLLLSQMRPGLIQLEIGVQSTNEPTIRAIHRSMQLERLKEVVVKIRQGGNIHQHLDLIAGLPYEDYPAFRRSFNEIYALRPEQLQLGFLKVLKGSYLYEHSGEYEMIYHKKPPYEVLATKWMSYEELLLIRQAEEMLEVYYNSGQYAVTMQWMEKLFSDAYAMYQALGAFYEKNGYFGMSHSRLRRCEILLEFLKSERGISQKQQTLFEEALTFDLYLRENCKSRPAWAPSASEWKMQTKKYCRNRTQQHLEPFHYDFLSEEAQQGSGFLEYRKEPVWIRFDYEERNPLNRRAKAERISVCEDAEEKSREG